MAVPRKNPAAVALGRLGGKKGGRARAAKMTPEQRIESSRKAAQARWANVHRSTQQKVEAASVAADTSDRALRRLLKQIKATEDPREIRQLSDQLERVIFHKQFENA